MQLYDYFDKYVQGMRSEITAVLRLGRSGLEADITALLDDFRPQDQGDVDSGTMRLCTLQGLTARIAKAFRDGAGLTTPQPSQQALDS